MQSMPCAITLSSISTLLLTLSACPADAGRSLYVWNTGWDNTVHGCTQAKFLQWSKTANPQCYTGNWDNPCKRDWLWKTLSRPGREITTIFLSSITQVLQTGYNAGTCSDSGIQQVKDTLIEGHAKVTGLKIYALFSVSDVNVGERAYVPWVVWYNNNCASGANEKFDGFSVNNEAFSKSWSDAQIQAYLDKLNEVHTDATAASLSTHYSVGWNWGRQSGSSAERIVAWNGLSANVTEHMVRIFDSVDIQVAFVKTSTVINRLYTASYGISNLLGKPVYFNLYTTKSSACTTTFFPQSCGWGAKTEANMWAVADAVTAQLGDATVSPHAYRSIYSSGGHTDWPAHRT